MTTNQSVPSEAGPSSAATQVAWSQASANNSPRNVSFGELQRVTLDIDVGDLSEEQASKFPFLKWNAGRATLQATVRLDDVDLEAGLGRRWSAYTMTSAKLSK
jgi:hypothetical protein